MTRETEYYEQFGAMNCSAPDDKPSFSDADDKPGFSDADDKPNFADADDKPNFSEGGITGVAAS
jgi:hypothetical protein